MANSKDFTISDLSGGFNDSDPPTSLQVNQCVVAENIDFFHAPCGARRKGCVSITLPDSLSSKDFIPFLYKHIPSTDASGAQLWALGVTLDTSIQLSYKANSWNDVTFIDDPTNSGVYPYQFVAKSFHGKLFFAYKSSKDRLHVFDGISLRPTGLAATTLAPTAVNSGSGSYATVRYFRTREIIREDDSTILRSEPSAVLTFTPSGSGAGAIITRPVLVNPNTTHWEIEASADNVDFYRLEVIVAGTDTYTDTTADPLDYATNGELSDDIGDYENIPSGRFLIVDQDRLLIGGSFETQEQASVIRWTPVLNDPGVGNDERIPVDTDNALNLDGSEEGGLTDLAGPIYGSIYAFKQTRIYKITRTGDVTAAYTAEAISKTRGALTSSVVEAVDEAGRPALYFLDPRVGPVRLGDGGFPNYQVILTAGADITTTWESVNVDASTVVCRSVFYPNKHQIHWWLATNGANTPNIRVTLQIDSSQSSKDGVRLGWTTHTGPTAQALAACLFSTNIEANTARSISEKPFIGVANTILMMDEGNDDDGASYVGTIVSRPYLLSGSVNNRFGIRAGSVIGGANEDAQVEVSLIRDFGREISPVVDISLAPEGAEDPVIQTADNLRMSASKVIQVKLTDGPENTGQWALHRIDLVPRAEETD